MSSANTYKFMSLKDAAEAYMREAQAGMNPDLWIVRTPKGKIFIDGGANFVSVSLSTGRRREFLVGEIGCPDNDHYPPLKDFFSERRLGSKYSF